MDEVRGPAKFPNRFNRSLAEKDHPVLVVIEKLSALVFKDEFSFEKLLIIKEINLEAGSRKGGYLDDQGIIIIVDDDVHTRQPDYFM
jgi:hypothetical protein